MKTATYTKSTTQSKQANDDKKRREKWAKQVLSKKDIDNFMENCDITIETNLDKHKLRII